MAVKALHLAKLFWTTELYLVAFDGATFNAKYADIFVNISAVIEQKRALIRCQLSHAGLEALVAHQIETNINLSRLAWCDYAKRTQPASR